MRFIINPFIRYESNFMGEMQGVTSLKREIPLMVSVTSSESSFKNLEISLYSIFNQSTKPDRIILWLGNEYELSELPYLITKYMKNGLEIKIVEDMGDYTNFIYALKEFSNYVIVTAEDNIYYPKNWLKKLYESYVASPSDIHVYSAKRVFLNEDKQIISCKNWQRVNEESARYDNFINSSEGILFPPKCFLKEVFREDIFMNEISDKDVWFWFMSLISGRKIRVVTNYIRDFARINPYTYFCQNRQRQSKNKKTDKEIKELMKYYGQNVISKIADK